MGGAVVRQRARWASTSPWERCESTENSEALESIDATLSEEPSETTEAKDPTLPTEPKDPTLPTESMDPTEPMLRKESFEARDHRDLSVQVGALLQDAHGRSLTHPGAPSRVRRMSVHVDPRRPRHHRHDRPARGPQRRRRPTAQPWPTRSAPSTPTRTPRSRCSPGPAAPSAPGADLKAVGTERGNRVERGRRRPDGTDPDAARPSR